ncbi:hypothetical protein [Streptomyces sp. NPDC058872]|uniref:hypothetical protein n=1 Tax=Streptomyces sp. NPDC058872 TaxID=3346661 RepID=UPI00368556A6
MAALIAGVALLATALIHLLVVLRKIWFDQEEAERMVRAFSRLPSGPEVQRGAVRGMATINAMLLTMGIFLVAVGSWELQGGGAMGEPLKTLLRVTLIGFLVLFAAHLSTIWFNFPRFLALPHMRGDAGLITAALRKRRNG